MTNIKTYKIGDKWSDDFDYNGMLKSGLKVSLKTPIKKMEDLLKSFTDVNYHSEGGHLSHLIKMVKSGNNKDAEKNLKDFKDSINKTLRNLSEGQNPHRKKYVDVISEGRRDDILNRFNENPELQKTVEEFLDHEFNKRTNYKYVNWVLKKNFDDFGNTFISLDSVINWLEKFDRVRKNLQYKDINQYKNIHDLIDTLEVYGDTKSEQRSKLKEGTERIYEDDRILVVKPLTKDSSCYYGSGTRWCTASTQFGNRFEQYNSKGPLYYLINKNMEPTNDYYKIAIHYDSQNNRMTLYDAKDVVNENLLGLIKTLPAFDAIQNDITQNHKWDRSVNIIDMFRKIFSGDSKLTQNFNFKRYSYMIDGKPLRLQGFTSGKLIGTWGVREFVLTVKDDDFVFYATKSNVLDERPIYEAIEYVENKTGQEISPDRIDKSLFTYVLYKIVDLFVEENSQFMTVGNDEITYWRPKNSQSNYRFESINPDNSYIKFLEYIRDRESQNEPASKRDFLINVLEKDPEKIVLSGYLSTMFSSMKDAGLVSLYRAKDYPYFRYKIGPNYNLWKQGRLKRI